MEIETQVLLAQELSYLDDNQAAKLLGVASEVGRILNGLLNSLPPRR